MSWGPCTSFSYQILGRSGTKLGRSLDQVVGTKFVEFSTKYNPEVIKYRPFMTKYTPGGAERRRVVYLLTFGVFFDHFGTVVRRKFDKFRAAIVKLHTNSVPIIAKVMTKKVTDIPYNLHI